MTTLTITPSEAAYQSIFDGERWREYPTVDEFEQRMGYALDREKLEGAARVLACPLKKHAPNWQHGRVLYAAAREYLDDQIDVAMLDLGTAKGFSALCLLWALRDADILGTVTSVDVIDPAARVKRNTVAEVDGLKTLAETLTPWPEASAIRFKHSTGIKALQDGQSRIHLCFIDGKHDQDVVETEGTLLAKRQVSGDLAIFDDVHIPGVLRAVQRLSEFYEVELLSILPNRAYAIGVRRG